MTKQAIASVLLCAACAAAAPVPLAWENPTAFTDGSAIPATLLPDLVVTIYAAPQASTNWTPVVTATNATTATVNLAPGAWQIRLTARFPGCAESVPSDILGGKVYGDVKKVGRAWIVRVTQ